MTAGYQLTVEEALGEFLAEQRALLAPQTFRRYEDVIWLLRECLERYGHSSLDAHERRRWEQAFEAGEEGAFCRLFGPEMIPEHLDGFLDWFMVRKVMAGQELLRASGMVTGKLVRWLSKRGYIDAGSAEAAADHASEINLDAIAEENCLQDHLAISDVEPGRIWFEGGVGPIAVPHQASDLARPGWSAFVTAARTAGSWQLLEIGFVYR